MTNMMASIAVFLMGLAFVSHSAKSLKLPALRPSDHRNNANLFARPDFFRGCSDVKHAVVLNKSTVDVFGRSSLIFVNAEGTLMRDSGVIKTAVLGIGKCKHSSDLNCEVENWRIGREICSLIEMKNVLWSPIFNSVFPRLHCPFKKGWYELRNASIDLTKFQALPLDLTKHYWRIRLDVWDYTNFVCFETGGRLVWNKKTV